MMTKEKREEFQKWYQETYNEEFCFNSSLISYCQGKKNTPSSVFSYSSSPFYSAINKQFIFSGDTILLYEAIRVYIATVLELSKELQAQMKHKVGDMVCGCKFFCNQQKCRPKLPNTNTAGNLGTGGGDGGGGGGGGLIIGGQVMDNSDMSDSDHDDNDSDHEQGLVNDEDNFNDEIILDNNDQRPRKRAYKVPLLGSTTPIFIPPDLPAHKRPRNGARLMTGDRTKPIMKHIVHPNNCHPFGKNIYTLSAVGYTMFLSYHLPNDRTLPIVAQDSILSYAKRASILELEYLAWLEFSDPRHKNVLIYGLRAGNRQKVFINPNDGSTIIVDAYNPITKQVIEVNKFFTFQISHRYYCFQILKKSAKTFACSAYIER